MWVVMEVLVLLVNMSSEVKIQKGDATRIRQMTYVELKATK